MVLDDFEPLVHIRTFLAADLGQPFLMDGAVVLSGHYNMKSLLRQQIPQSKRHGKVYVLFSHAVCLRAAIHSAMSRVDDDDRMLMQCLCRDNLHLLYLPHAKDRHPQDKAGPQNNPPFFHIESSFI